MGSYAALPHPPPPKVPDGWKPIWNEQYSEYLFVNVLTRQSIWEKPTEAARDESGNIATQDRSMGFPSSRHGGETDEEMARRLQNDERTRNGNSDGNGHAKQYYSGEPVSHGPHDQEGIHNGGNQSSNRGVSGTGGGLRDKIRSKIGSNRSSMGGAGGCYPPPHQGPMSYGGGGPMMGGPVYAPPPQSYGYGYGMPPQPMYMQQPMRRRPGMGPGGGAALGLGGGLLGGMMLGNAMNSGQQGAYQDGFADGADFDGGDMDGGDFGGDFGE